MGNSPAESSEDRALLLSERLATLHLASMDAAAITAEIGNEAVRLFDGERAIVWSYRPAIGRLFAEVAGEEVRSVEITPGEARDVLRRTSLWQPEVVGVRRRLVEASFGVARDEPTPTLAVPLRLAEAPLGLLLLRLEDWRGAGTAVSRIEQFAAQAAALLANYEALERTRRNEAQLKALYETAGEISSRLELETVLASIVERARGLVEAPIAYLMLVDRPAEEIYMRVTSGVTSPTFGAIRLRLGAGLGGMVAQEEEPFYTSDYLNDVRFQHEPAVDEEVRREGIKSILGVPLKAFDTFVGVLYIADRAVRSFTGVDVDVLMSLAHHAALAIENARLYEQTTKALAELEEATHLIHLHHRRLERADEVHRQLSEVLLAGHGLSGVIRLMAELLGKPVVVLDEHHRPLAAAGTAVDAFGQELAARGLNDTLRADAGARGAVARLARFCSTLLDPRPPSRTRSHLVVPIVASAELLGSVWVEADSDQIEEEEALIEQAVRVVGLELLKERSVADAERRLRRELLDELLTARPGSEEMLARRAADLGVDLRHPYRLAVASVAAGERVADAPLRGGGLRAHEQLVTALRSRRWCDFAAESAGRAIALVRSDAPDAVAELRRLIEQLIADGLRVRAVLSPPCRRIRDYRDQLLAAERVLHVLRPSRRGKEAVVDLEEALVLALLFRDGGDSELHRFARARLDPVLRQRPRRRAELLRTLEVYLESGCSPTRAAAALHVHVNTVYYRLARLRELLGRELAAPHRALDLQVALIAYRSVGENLEEDSEDIPGFLES